MHSPPQILLANEKGRASVRSAALQSLVVRDRPKPVDP